MSLKRSSGSTPGVGSELLATPVDVLDDLTDVNLTGIADADYLVYDAGETQGTVSAATASNTWEGSPSNTFDGSESTYWMSYNTIASWLRLDMGSAVTLNQIRILQSPTSTYRTSSFKIEWSDNDTDFYDIQTFTGMDSASWKTEAFASTTARYFRLTLVVKPTSNWVIMEVELWNTVPVWVPVAPGVFAKADASALPVIELTQADVDEDYIKITGTSDTSADRALVDAANFTTPGSIVGWLKIAVVDEQGTDPITDGDYYIPFYSVPTA